MLSRPVREKVFGKSYSLENGLRELSFQEDLFLYNCLQHSSGLDFLYFHKNNVWGVGPKIGGNSAGLLNFGSHVCPYSLWQVTHGYS